MQEPLGREARGVAKSTEAGGLLSHPPQSEPEPRATRYILSPAWRGWPALLHQAM